MKNINIDKIQAGENKLRGGISTFNKGDFLSKGKKTVYGAASKLDQELIEQYITLTKSENKVPNVKSLIIYAKSINFTQIGRKIQLFPTKEQEELLLKHIDAYRWTYNFLFADRLQKAIIPFRQQKLRAKSYAWLNKIEYKEPKFPNWNAKSGNQPDWMKDVSADIINSCIKLFPNSPSGFRNKDKAAKQFVNLQGNKVKITKEYIKLSKIGEIKYNQSQYISSDAKICSIGISYKNKKWFAGINFQINKPKPQLKIKGKTIGVDVGVRKLATIWDGEKYAVYGDRDSEQSKKRLDNLFRLEKDKIRWQRKANRRFKQGAKQQSNRYHFAREQVSRICEKIYNIRNNNLHQISHRILRRDTKEIVVETLNVKGMLTKSKKPGKTSKSKALRKNIAEASMGKLLSNLKYKASWRGIKLTAMDQFFASSKICSNCFEKNSELKGEETWKCGVCKVKHDRDKNASKNLQRKLVEVILDSSCDETEKDLISES